MAKTRSQILGASILLESQNLWSENVTHEVLWFPLRFPVPWEQPDFVLSLNNKDFNVCLVVCVWSFMGGCVYMCVYYDAKTLVPKVS